MPLPLTHRPAANTGGRVYGRNPMPLNPPPAGLIEPARCGRDQTHPAHRFMLGRRVYQCPGADPKPAPDDRCGEECAEGHVYAGRCELAAPSEYSRQVNAPLSPETATAINKRLASDAPRRKVRTTPDNPATSSDPADNPALRDRIAAALREWLDDPTRIMLADGVDAVLAALDGPAADQNGATP